MDRQAEMISYTQVHNLVLHANYRSNRQSEFVILITYSTEASWYSKDVEEKERIENQR